MHGFEVAPGDGRQRNGVDIWPTPMFLPSSSTLPLCCSLCVSRSFLHSPFPSLCHSATNGENMRCSSRSEGRAATVLQLGPAYCFFRAKGLTYEPHRRMGASETTVPAGHLCSSCDDSETCSVRRLLCMYFSHSLVSTLLSILWF